MPAPYIRSLGIQRPGYGSASTTGALDLGITEEGILAAQKEQAEDVPWWVQVFRFPDRLFGGQSVKGFLAGTGEEGIADNITEGLRKNPLFQLMDSFLGTDLTGDYTEFVDVRRNLFGETDVEEGALNFAFNLFGEILTDPSSFLTIGGKIPGKAVRLGRGADDAADLGRSLNFVPHPTAAEGKTVWVDVNKIDAAWSKEPGFYIPKGGGGAEIAGRRPNFENFISGAQPIQQPYVAYSGGDAVSFIDGRHRFSIMRDQGAKSIPVSIAGSPEEIQAFASRFGTRAPVPEGGSLIKEAGRIREANTMLEKTTIAKTHAMMVFKVPFTDRGFVFQPFKSMEIGLANAVDSTATFLNTSPLTRPVVSVFFPEAARVKDPLARGAVRESIEAGKATVNELEFQASGFLSRVVHENPKAFRDDADAHTVLTSLMELGMERTDDVVSLPRILETGSSYGMAQTRLKKLAESNPEFNALRQKALSGDGEALQEFMESFPDIPLRAESDFNQVSIQKLLNEHGYDLRPGVDMRHETRQYTALSENARLLSVLQREHPWSHAVPGVGAPARAEMTLGKAALDGRVPIPDGGLTLHIEDGGKVLSSEGVGDAVRLSPATKIFDVDDMQTGMLSSSFFGLTTTSAVPADRKLFWALGNALKGQKGTLDRVGLFDLVEKLREKTGSQMSAEEVLSRLLKTEESGEVVGGLAKHWHGFKFDDGKIEIFNPEQMLADIEASKGLADEVLDALHSTDIATKALRGRGDELGQITLDIGAEGTDMAIVRATTDEELARLTGGLGFEGAAIEGARAEVLGAYHRILQREDGVETLEQIVNGARGGQELMEMIAKADKAAGLINETTMPYFPRVISEEVRDLINTHFRDTIKEQFGNKALAHSTSFMKQRAFTDLTTVEINYIARELGIKFTGHQPLKEIAAREKELGILARLQEGLTKKLKAMGTPESVDVAELFETNPLTAFQTRLRRSQKALTRANIVNNFVAEGSPLVVKTTRLGDLEATLGQTHPGLDLIPVLATTKDEFTTAANATSLPRLIGVGLTQERSAAAMLARETIRETIDQAIIEGKETFKSLSDKMRVGATGLAPIETRLFKIDPTKGHAKEILSAEQRTLLTVSDDDFWAVAAYKQNLSALADLYDQIRNPALTKEAKRELRATIDLAKSNLETQQGAMKLELQGLDEITDTYTGVKAARKALEDQKSLIKQARAARKEDLKTLRRERLGEIRAWKNKRLEASEVQDAIQAARANGKRGSLALNELMETNPEAAARLRQAMPDAQVHWMRRDVYAETLGDGGVLDRMFSAKHWQEFPNLLDRMTSLWKVWTALPFPQARIRDAVSNLALLTMGGTSPAGIAQAMGPAARITKAYGKLAKGAPNELGEILVKRVVDGTEEVLTGQELVEAAARRGLIDRSFARDVLVEAGVDAAKVGGFGKESIGEFVRTVFTDVEKNPVIKTAAKTAGWLDNHSKLTGIIAEWKAGKSLDDAALHTRKWSYQGGATLSAAEQGIRRFVPFYSWTRFAVEKGIQTYFQRPGALGFWEKLHRNANRAKGLSPAEFEAVAPEFIRDNLGVAIPWMESDEGIKLGILGSYVPLGDITRLVSAIEGQLDRTQQDESLVNYVGSTLAPQYKVALEWIRNKSFFTGREIEQFPGDSDEMFGIEMPNHMRNLIKNVRFLSEVDKLNIFNAGDVSRMLSDPGNAVPRIGKQSTFSERLLSGGFGALPKIYTSDPAEEADYRGRKLKTQASRTRSLLRKRIENKGVPGQEADIESLRQRLTELLGELKTSEEVKSRYTQ